ncbi:MAG: transcriptional repressor [Methylobacteriaceae bacterium]|nr:transcriptional repressor [Methylobacteriaceae bacterium]HPG02657.1 Fur family transcriptional regulator [Rhodoblastus sp.]
MRRTRHDHDDDHDHAQDAAGGPAPGRRLTPGRKAVLDILEQARRPIGAYEMIDLLAASVGRRPAPTQVYRALDFLVEQGLVHRLASRNAFLACGHSHEASEPVAFLICDGCGHVDEATSPALAADVADVADKLGFAPRAQIIEIAGRCADCATKDVA